MSLAYWGALLFLAVGLFCLCYLPHPDMEDYDDDERALTSGRVRGGAVDALPRLRDARPAVRQAR